MRIRSILRPAVGVVLLLSAWSALAAQANDAEPWRLRVAPVTTPAGPQSGQPFLTRNRDFVPYASWVERKRGKKHALRYSRFDAPTFEDADTIATGENWFVNWADVPSLTIGDGGTLAAHWLERNGAGTFSYGVRVACAMEGRGWSTPFWLHEDRSPAEHGFVSVQPAGDGRFAAVWLDGRSLKSKREMTLRTVAFDRSGPRGEETLLDPRVCECCPTAAVRTERGLLVAYRDRSAEEIRDIYLVDRTDGRWSKPWRLAADDWTMPG